MSRTRVAVLLSGRGTNAQALLDACAEPGFPAEVAVIVSNRREAEGLARARAANVPAVWVPHRDKTREDFESQLLQVLERYQVEWVCLAGFMRLLTPHFLAAYPGRVLNIHPSLLPAFPGRNGQDQALEAGVRIAGATVHLVDAGTDTGPIVLQGALGLNPGCSTEALKAALLLQVEHPLYVRALRYAAEGRIQVANGRVALALPEGDNAFVWGGTAG